MNTNERSPAEQRQLSKEKFLNEHIEDLQKAIWLLEISRDILTPIMKITNRKEDIDQIIKMQTNFANQIKGHEQRIQYVMKVINGTIGVSDTEKPSNFIAKEE